MPVLLAFLAIALSSLHASEVHAETGQLQQVQVQQIDDDIHPADFPSETAEAHCTMNLSCHAQGLLAAAASLPDDTAVSGLAWSEAIVLRDGRCLAVPTPPPLAARA
ncbi:hypothetical protein [Mesobacterium pallidum]|uniref:hypothetical protein n=1 Tax=Mesobacterium pallidum TaxID=2872037 RepID=UPI001EE350DD|nr:hypothetical protein [Mesobacterium pallidum]